MRISTLAAIITTAIAATIPLMAQQPPAPREDRIATAVPQKKPLVQIAILLDTSNSMDGLIEQAKSQLWKVVNEFAKAQRGGLRPDIQVALYQYGTPSLGKENDYIKQLTPLTDDLDKVSAELFKLTTNGGDEYCGSVIQKATEQLEWSTGKDTYKAIFIAGNEPFTQGTVDFHTSCKAAISKGIIVNTIFCGDQKEGIDTGWKDGAALADGSYMSINQNAVALHIEAPQDKELAELGSKINQTYVTYGARGAPGAENQLAQDKNARGGAGAGPAAATAPAAIERAITKGNAIYQNSTWDLVDAVNAKKVALKDLKDEELPEEMRKLDQKDREDFVAAKQKERADMQARIQKLSADRDTYLADKKKVQAEGTLDTAIINAVRDQATNNGMTFEKPK